MATTADSRLFESIKFEVCPGDEGIRGIFLRFLREDIVVRDLDVYSTIDEALT